MTGQPAATPTKTVAVIGGGLSGSLFALKLSRARPDFAVIVIESGRRLGRGLAYGACAPEHLLNVPVSRMEVGLAPSFAVWLERDDRRPRPRWRPALVESGGDLQAAFAPRALFGQYLQTRVSEALIVGDGPRTDGGAWGSPYGSEPGRLVERATGRWPRDRSRHRGAGHRKHVTARARRSGHLALRQHDMFVPDPCGSPGRPGREWPRTMPSCCLGTGLTSVDIVLKLNAAGHRGPMLALSRRGLTPHVHAGGGAWPAFLEEALPASPRALLRLFRDEVARARAAGVPWQRVFDAARPAVPAVWRGWSLSQKRQFLRRLRPRWDVHRHRMAPRVAACFEALIDSGRLRIAAGRVTAYRRLADAGGAGVEIAYSGRGGDGRFVACHVINCTGPRRDLAQCGLPLLADLREQGLATPDALGPGLGLETDDGALLDDRRRPSARLFALGAL